MDLYFYNTLTRRKEKFVPVEPSLVRMYTCGPTVYRDVHLGNFRTYLLADLARRVLEYNGYRVRKIQNITDVGHMRRQGNETAFDPVIKAALEAGKTPLEITADYSRKFFEDSAKLNLLEADVYPRASDHVREIIQIVADLLRRGYAYDSGENIYFDTKKFKAYGKLSGNTLSKMDRLLEAVRVASEADKIDSADFVLWKRVGPDYLMKWDSPWGLGSPGWHIECTAMSLKYLSDAFGNPAGPFYRKTIDFHTGGEDNIFPHHEDEIAQSETWTGQPFVNYWLHGGHLTIEGGKMARRSGNVYLVADLISRGFEPLAFRYLALTAYYRSKMNFTWAALEAANKALNRLYELVQSPDEAKIGCAEYEEKFLAAVNDDLDLPKALDVVWDLVKSDYPISAKKATLLKFDQVLGLGLDSQKTYVLRPTAVSLATVSPEISEEEFAGILPILEARERARKSGDFVKADERRRELFERGYKVEDTPSGPKVDRSKGL